MRCRALEWIQRRERESCRKNSHNVQCSEIKNSEHVISDKMRSRAEMGEREGRGGGRESSLEYAPGIMNLSAVKNETSGENEKRR